MAMDEAQLKRYLAGVRRRADRLAEMYGEEPIPDETLNRPYAHAFLTMIEDQLAYQTAQEILGVS